MILNQSKDNSIRSSAQKVANEENEAKEWRGQTWLFWKWVLQLCFVLFFFEFRKKIYLGQPAKSELK